MKVSAADYRAIQQAAQAAKLAQARAGHRLLSDADVAHVMGILVASLDRLKRSDDPAKAWEDLALAVNLAETFSQMRLVGGAEADAWIEKAKNSLAALVERHNTRNTWAMKAEEIDALDALLTVHRVQLENVTYREYEKAFYRTQARMRQALKTGKGKGVRIVDLHQNAKNASNARNESGKGRVTEMETAA